MSRETTGRSVGMMTAHPKLFNEFIFEACVF